MSDVNMDKFKVQLKRQLGYLQRSCSLYDMGYHDEAIRIATIIRVLMHDTTVSTSLLTHLNAKSINLFTNSPELPEPPEEGYQAVVVFNMGIIRMGAKAGYGPNLEDFLPSSPVLPVDRWWNQLVWIIHPDVKLTRKDIVLAAVNQDGGAHVDGDLMPGYKELASRSWGTLTIKKGGKKYQQSFINMHLVAIRTMGNELLKSPELISLV